MYPDDSQKWLQVCALSLWTHLEPSGWDQEKAWPGQCSWEPAVWVKILLFLAKINFFKEKVDKALESFLTMGLQ